MFKRIVIAFCFFIAIVSGSSAQTNIVSNHWAIVDGVRLFYRSAGDPKHPVIVLLHGFPSSSIMYRDLMQLLKNDFYLIAPDYPAHGYSHVPPAGYDFTFDNISNTVYTLLNQLGIHKYSLYMQDYGAPVGFRMAVKHPENIEALIIQNGNAYMEGFPEAQDPNGELQQYWKNKNRKYETNWINFYRNANLIPFDQQKLDTAINIDSRMLNATVMLTPGRLELFMRLWFDYGNNVKSYPVWHAFLKKYQPPVLITWGKEDTFFTVPGALAYLKDVPKAEVHLLNGGHWAATNGNTQQIAELILSFFKRNTIQ
ncbi:Pimeloyl-ACP methyl ester carboxylesterase [Mucilaginibacter lappiensis]|uniref:Pimeloyl-ACP methyl ester carboxylesterase n=1 Tax=Mucilaginibacter lappiensis TaxID=354630 RepID=A0ABR6PDC2_9SPHI|nr:alpha/beta hydrolase [Mucilaginibacter lappiensis]MBB6107755.1 pimeloyl-ACP methyl ester carboxylesterase [Mucilaginibacter lappiensis]SIP98140.1 Pimeloyl-ACP methyl ester carboxylesterase [Mucilaginibacter lappiensis]